MPARIERHRQAGEALVEGFRAFGFRPLVEARHRLPMLTSLRVPAEFAPGQEAQLRRRLLDRYGIEVGGGLGPLAGKIWRIGLMGENARLTSVESLFSALRRELA